MNLVRLGRGLPLALAAGLALLALLVVFTAATRGSVGTGVPAAVVIDSAARAQGSGATVATDGDTDARPHGQCGPGAGWDSSPQPTTAGSAIAAPVIPGLIGPSSTPVTTPLSNQQVAGTAGGVAIVPSPEGSGAAGSLPPASPTPEPTDAPATPPASQSPEP